MKHYQKPLVETGSRDQGTVVEGRSRRSRAVAGGLALAFVVVSLAATLFGGWLQFEVVEPGWDWGWLQQVVAVPVSLALLAVLNARGILTFREAGFVARIQAGSAIPALVATLAAILLVTLANLLAGNAFVPFAGDAETVAYQATMPGLSEEIVYRGAVLGLLGFVFAERFRLFGASFGLAMILQALVFALLHGLGGPIAFGYALSFALLVGWIRMRTGSLWPCVLAHNAVNVSSFSMFV